MFNTKLDKFMAK